MSSYVLLQCGFFKRAAYFHTLQKHHAVKISKKEQYQVNEGFLIIDTKKKHWITSWTDNKQCYWWKCSHTVSLRQDFRECFIFRNQWTLSGSQIQLTQTRVVRMQTVCLFWYHFLTEEDISVYVVLYLYILCSEWKQCCIFSWDFLMGIYDSFFYSPVWFLVYVF